MKNIFQNKYFLIILTLIVGGIIGWMIKPSSSAPISDAHEHTIDDQGIWTCSMHPQIRQNEPGACPICGMDLIPLANDDGNQADPMAVRMSPTAMALANVQTAMVGNTAPAKSIRLNGKVQVNESLLSKIPAHFHGRIEKLYVNFTGELIQKGQLLAEVYSPELVTAQQELQIAYQNKETDPQLYQSARKKLENWKISASEIEKIETKKQTLTLVKINAHHGGYVLKRNVSQGDHVQMGDILFEIAKLDKVWLLFDVYESDMQWVKKGNHINFTVASFPGETFRGKISYLDPVIDPKSRVVKARVEVNNSDLRLKPEMFASGIIEASLSGGETNLIVPKSAVMWTGQRSVVYVKDATEDAVSFRMREVTLGPSLGESYVIEQGLSEGEEIAVNGAFSIDAAAQLAGKPSMMSPEGGAGMSGHHHGTVSATNSPVSQPNSAKVMTDLKPLLAQYIMIKNTLVEDNLSEARAMAQAFIKEISNVDMSVFKGSDHQLWMSQSKALTTSADLMAQSQSIAEARNHFIDLSGSLLELTREFKPTNESVYVQFCPMADNNQGAIWLSLEQDIRNPYFGEAMLTCGNVEEVL